MSTETTSYFEVQYKYYMYNTGAADNGYYTRSIRKVTADEAAELAAKIEKHAIHHRYHHGSQYDRPLEKDYDPSSYTEDDADEARMLINDLLPDHGYFISAKAFETEIKRTPLPIKQLVREPDPTADNDLTI